MQEYAVSQGFFRLDGSRELLYFMCHARIAAHVAGNSSELEVSFAVWDERSGAIGDGASVHSVGLAGCIWRRICLNYLKIHQSYHRKRIR